MDYPSRAAFDPSSCKSLYVGNLHPYVNEAMLQEIFATLGPVAEVKVIKDKVTGMSAGYGFIKFLDHRAADLALQSINGRVLYGQEVRVNWAFQKDQREDTATHSHVFVGDLSSEVTDRLLFEAFQPTGGCSDARVMWDHSTGRSKGYGFVSFRSREEAENAIQAVNGSFIGHRRVRCGWAQHKADANASDITSVDRSDPSNANVYVGNIAPEVSDAELRRHFQQFGNILEVKSYRKGSYGFVQFEQHVEAVHAIVGMNGQVVGGKPLKCSWGRHQTSRGPGGIAGPGAGQVSHSQVMMQLANMSLLGGPQPGLLNPHHPFNNMMQVPQAPLAHSQAGQLSQHNQLSHMMGPGSAALGNIGYAPLGYASMGLGHGQQLGPGLQHQP
ncbi:hypothetical protein WJX73_010245 [Symbiochloris irregularis]|uniref:RRM domain-containing protein n=1 Tax=Symbiochloris irregularis TaxID=706552 RepID=A0AAW1PZM8_9CHLO